MRRITRRQIQVCAAAGIALLEPFGTNDAVLTTAALRANEPVGPAPLRDGYPAQVLGTIEGHKTGLREALLKLDAVARHSSSL